MNVMQHDGCRPGELNIGDRVVAGGVCGFRGPIGGTVVKVKRLDRKDGDALSVKWDNGHTGRARSCELERE